MIALSIIHYFKIAEHLIEQPSHECTLNSSFFCPVKILISGGITPPANLFIFRIEIGDVVACEMSKATIYKAFFKNIWRAIHETSPL